MRFHPLRIFAWSLLAALSARAELPPPAARPVDFAREIEPLLQAHCVKCHGPEKQKGGWRADLKALALRSGDNYAPNIVPGKSAESPLIRFVAGLEPEMKMPAKGDPLTPEEIGLLRAWIDQGAAWPEGAEVAGSDPLDWWSLRPLQLPAVPVVAGTGNPIDAFVRARLAEQHLSPAHEADRRTLVRRLFFDLTGLPPTPEEAQDFVADPDPQAYEKLVDRLLASPRYGERWGRHWLDVAHYGDSHGYDKDKPRAHAWPYRDYVIRAFNEDKPYGRFVQEQIAGDVLFPLTRDGVEALGFLAAGPWDLIGHMEVPETKRDGKIARNLDRDDMVASTLNTFCSTTVQCARCHNHKFDHFISQENYYSLQAVFAALDRADKRYDYDPEVARQRNEGEARRQALLAHREALRRSAVQKAGPPLAAIETRLAALSKPHPGQTSRAEAYGYHSGIAAGPETTKWVQVDLGTAQALSEVALQPCRDSFAGIGDGFGFPVRFKIEASDDPEFQQGVVLIADETKSDFANPGLRPVVYPLNGQVARCVRVTATRLALRQKDYIFALAELSVKDVTQTIVSEGAAVSALDSIEAAPRWRRTNLTDGYFPGGSRLGDPEELARLQAEGERLRRSALSVEESAALARTEQEIAATERRLGALPPPHSVYAGTIHTGTGAFTGTGASGGKPRLIQILHRGDVENPRQAVGPGALPIFGDPEWRLPVPEDAPEGERRAALARWVADERNPLTWRSIVNRVWQYHFGKALVETPNDFGRMGQLPSHPELLDWLAADFRDGGQSLKKLHRLIVTSATWKQSAAIPAEALARDADNRWLGHMSRRRLEAEAVRDAALQCAGQLDLTMGGPGFRDFVVEHPENSPHYEYELFDPADPASHRRSVYRFIVRSQPQPFLSVLDCADPSLSVEKRNESLSALQALALLNDRFVLSTAGAFAARVRGEAPDRRGQVERAFRLALGRAPADGELHSLERYAGQYGMEAMCRVLFNLNEFSFVD